MLTNCGHVTLAWGIVKILGKGRSVLCDRCNEWTGIKKGKVTPSDLLGIKPEPQPQEPMF